MCALVRLYGYETLWSDAARVLLAPYITRNFDVLPIFQAVPNEDREVEVKPWSLLVCLFWQGERL